MQDKIAEIEAWEENFKRVDSALPITKKETGTAVNGVPQAPTTVLGHVSTQPVMSFLVICEKF